MNMLGLVFGLLMIFACTFSLSLRKQSIAIPVEQTYQAHQSITRKILNSYETQCFEKLPHKKKATPENLAPLSANIHSRKPQQLNINHINGNCARLNLWPLIQEGRDQHPMLYEIATQILRASYSHFFEQPRLEYALLDALLVAAKQTLEPHVTRLSLEKLSLKSDSNIKQLYSLPSTYYRMLKGTKQQGQDTSYPSLLELFTLEQKETQICLLHASFELFTALFGSKAGLLLYRELHQSELPLLKEQIHEICVQAGVTNISNEMLDLLDFHTVHHALSKEKMLAEEESGVYLKRRVFLPG